MPRQHGAPDNPCAKEHKSSLNCLSEQNYDKEACEPYFNNYNSCMKFWSMIRFERRIRGIAPELPEPKDRDRIKKEFLATGNVHLTEEPPS